MSEPLDLPIRAVRLRNVRDTQTTDAFEGTWRELLGAHDLRTEKDGPAFVPATFRPGGLRRKSDVETVNALVFDFDHLAEREARAVMEKAKEIGAGIVYTTHSHCENGPDDWRFRLILPTSRPMPPHVHARAWRAVGWALGGGADAAAKDPSRLYFLPSCPAERAESKRLVAWSGECLDVDRIPEEASPPKGDPPAPLPMLAATGDGRVRRARAWLARREPAIEGQGGDAHTYKTACALRDFGLDEGEALNLLAAEWNPSCVPPWEPADLAAKVRSAYAYAQNPPGMKLAELRPAIRPEVRGATALDLRGAPPLEAPPLAPRDDRPEIRIHTDERDVNDQAIDALSRDPEVFQRGGILVRLDCDGATLPGVTLPAEAPRIVKLPEATLREKLAACAAFLKFDKKSHQWVPAHPPDWTVKACAARGDWPQVHPLVAVVEAPMLRPDGSVLSRPGYDEATRLVYRPSTKPIPVPETPTVQQVREAVGALRDVVRDFPFATEAHEAAWVAGLLTPLATHAFGGSAPLTLVDANIRGAGKSLLCEAIALIVTGRRMAAMGNAPEEELEKRITSLMIEGAPLVMLDNVTGTLGCEALDRALTSGTWKSRILGTNNTVSLPMRSTWYANGNNVILNGDTTRRVLHVRLRSPEERPEERGGLRSLRRWIPANRSRLLAAALTILRGYCAAGRPDQHLKPWGSFEEWTALVRGAVVWAGLEDPGKTREALATQSDTEAAMLAGLLAGIGEMGGGTVTEILASVDRFPVLKAALAEMARGPEQLPSPKALGKRLTHLRDRVLGGRALQSRPARAGRVEWVVREVTADAAA